MSPGAGQEKHSKEMGRAVSPVPDVLEKWHGLMLPSGFKHGRLEHGSFGSVILRSTPPLTWGIFQLAMFDETRGYNMIQLGLVNVGLARHQQPRAGSEGMFPGRLGSCLRRCVPAAVRETLGTREILETLQ